MIDGEFSFSAAIFALIAGALVLTVIKLIWGMAQWGHKSTHRMGSSMANTRAEVTEWAGQEGYVSADGELWRARAKQTLTPGDKVTVTRVDGLTLEVRKQ